ncbi:MAG: ABC transporter substrate-binding protein [Cyanobacteria bacterium J06607_13]
MFDFRYRFKRQFYVLLALVSMGVLLSFSACSGNLFSGGAGARETLPKEFRIGYQLTAGPETLVKALGTMEAAFPQVNIRWQSYDSGRDVNDAIASGTVDVGLIGSVPVSTGIANNLPYQVYFILNILGDNEALAIAPDANIETTADLVGKIIAVPFGSTTHFSLLSALEQDGIDPEAVRILDMQPQDLLAAWQFGEIDGGFVWQPTLSRMLDEGGSILVSARQLAENGVITADLGVVSNAFAERYPKFLQHYVAALDSAVQLYRNQPEVAAEAMSQALALSTEESLTVMNELVWLTAEEQRSEKYMGTPEAAGELSQVLKDSAEFLVEQGELPSAPELSAYEQALFSEAISESSETVSMP